MAVTAPPPRIGKYAGRHPHPQNSERQPANAADLIAAQVLPPAAKTRKRMKQKPGLINR